MPSDAHKRANQGQGILYSVTGGRGAQGTLFRVNKDGTGYEIIHAFSSLGGEGRNPYAGVVEGSDGNLYGTTLNGGADLRGLIYRIDVDGSDYQILFSFPNKGLAGRGPYAGLILEGDDVFYGTTTGEGAGGAGAVFCLRLKTTGK